MNLVSLYLFTFSDGRRYVGVTCDISRRFKEHAKAATVVGRAWRSLGAPEIVVLAVGHDDYIYEMESRFVDELRTLWPSGLNRIEGGLGGRKASAETKRLMSQSRTGLSQSPESIAKIAASKTGAKRPPFSAEWKANLSAGKRGLKYGPLSAERRAKMSASLKGRVSHEWTAESRAKLAATKRRQHAEGVYRSTCDEQV